MFPVGAGDGADGPFADAEPEFVDVFEVLGGDADGAVGAVVVAGVGREADVDCCVGSSGGGEGGEVGLGGVPEGLADGAFEEVAVGFLGDEGCGWGLGAVVYELEGEGGCHGWEGCCFWGWRVIGVMRM